MPAPKDPEKIEQWKFNCGKSFRGKKMKPEAHLGKKNPMYGKHHTEEWKKNNSELKKGNQYRKDIPHTEETKRKIGVSNKGKTTSEKNPRWKGGLYGYYHEKARQLFGSSVCQDCGITLQEYVSTQKQKQFDMHCVSKDYTILEQWNWRCLCRKCHKKVHKLEEEKVE